jgi:hypothetical protein
MLLRVSAASQPITYVIKFQPSDGLPARQINGARHNTALDCSFDATKFVIAASSTMSVKFIDRDGRLHA